MFKEMLHYLIEDANPVAKRNGYTYESIALKERYLRNKIQWQPHILNCHDFILKKIDSHPMANSIMIFGSGHLIEIPIEQILAKFEKIYLVDLVHPKSVKELATLYSQKIILISADLSSYFEVSNVCLPKTDLVFSANMISQIAFLPGKKMLDNGMPADLVWKESRKILQQHLRWLKALSIDRKVFYFCDDKKMVSTTDRLNRNSILSLFKKNIFTQTQINIDDSANDFTDEFTTIYDIHLPFEDEWIWDIALSPEYKKNQDVRLHMIAGTI